MDHAVTFAPHRIPWNKHRLVGQKQPLRLKEVWAIRIRLQLAQRTRDLALFNLAIDSKLRGCDLISLRVCDVAQGSHVVQRALVLQRRTGRPVQFELTEQTRDSVQAWLVKAHLLPGQHSVSEPTEGVAPSISKTIRPGRQALGCFDQPKPGGVRYTLDAPHQADAHLPADQEPARGSAPTGPY